MENSIKITSVLGFILLVLSCSHNPGIERHLVPEKSLFKTPYDKEQPTTVSRFGEIYVEHLSDLKLKKIFKSSPFAKPEESTRKLRIPPFTFFQVTIQNRSRSPVYFEEPALNCTGKVYQPFSLNEFKSKTVSPVYRSIDHEAFLSKRILTTDRKKTVDINYSEDTEIIDDAFIPPGDTVIIHLIFDWIPAEYRSLNLTFKLNDSKIAENIEITFTRTEYRTDGEHFIRRTGNN